MTVEVTESSVDSVQFTPQESIIIFPSNLLQNKGTLSEEVNTGEKTIIPADNCGKTTRQVKMNWNFPKPPEIFVNVLYL